jgi:hypothetical protein
VPSKAALEVEVRGLRELEAAWPAFARRDTEAVKAVALTVAGITADQTRVRVPYRTGGLAGSVYKVGSTSDPPTATVGEGRGIGYARWVEFRGKRGRSRGRYLIPTARRQVNVLKKRAAVATQDTIGRFPWPNPRP